MLSIAGLQICLGNFFDFREKSSQALSIAKSDFIIESFNEPEREID